MPEPGPPEEMESQEPASGGVHDSGLRMDERGDRRDELHGFLRPQVRRGFAGLWRRDEFISAGPWRHTGGERSSALKRVLPRLAMASAMAESPGAKRRDRNETVYYWDSQDGKTKKARVERYSTRSPENILLQNGHYVKYDAVFDERHQADSYGALASGSTVVDSPQKGKTESAWDSDGGEAKKEKVEGPASASEGPTVTVKQQKVDELAPGSGPGSDGLASEPAVKRQTVEEELAPDSEGQKVEEELAPSSEDENITAADYC